MNERNFGPAHVETAKALTNLGSAYGGLGDFARQRDLQVWSLLRARAPADLNLS